VTIVDIFKPFSLCRFMPNHFLPLTTPRKFSSSQISQARAKEVGKLQLPTRNLQHQTISTTVRVTNQKQQQHQSLNQRAAAKHHEVTQQAYDLDHGECHLTFCGLSGGQ
jgi:hypothetical protein